MADTFVATVSLKNGTRFGDRISDEEKDMLMTLWSLYLKGTGKVMEITFNGESTFAIFDPKEIAAIALVKE